MAGTAAAIPETETSKRFSKRTGFIPPMLSERPMLPGRIAPAQRRAAESITPEAPARKQQAAASSAIPIFPKKRSSETETAPSAARITRFRFAFFFGGFSFGRRRTPCFSEARSTPLPGIKTGLKRRRKRRSPARSAIRMRKPSSCQRSAAFTRTRKGRKRNAESSAAGRTIRIAERSDAAKGCPSFSKLPKRG